MFRVKTPFTELFLHLLYIILASTVLLFPFFYGLEYNADVEQYINSFDAINGQSLFSNMVNNTLSIKLLSKVFFFLSPSVLMYFIYGIAIVFLSYILYKYLNIYYILSVFFISFFSLYMNQSREAIAICFGVLAWKNIREKPILGVFLLLLSLIFHLFAFLFVCIIISVELLENISYKIKLALVSGVALFLVALLFLESRYTYYVTQQEYKSYFFLLLGGFIILLWKSFSSIDFKVLFILLFITTALTACFPALSSRLTEISIFFLFLNSNYSLKNNTFVRKYQRTNVGVLLIAFVIFVYRVLVVFCFEKDRNLIQGYIFNFF